MGIARTVSRDWTRGLKRSRSGRSFAWPRCCSSVKARCGDSPCVTPSGQPKSLTAPSAPIYEMTSNRNPVFLKSRFYDSISEQLSHAEVELGEQGLGEGIPVGKSASTR